MRVTQRQNLRASGNTKNLEAQIRRQLTDIRQSIKSGDDTRVLLWVVAGTLAASQRPLRDDSDFGGRGPLPPQARPKVEQWVTRIVNEEGIRSILCLLESAQLERYYGSTLHLHRGGLLGFYESRGLSVHHIPATDYQRPPVELMTQALNAFEELPKPVLVHCSAGIDRTTPIVAFIANALGVSKLSQLSH
jgi:Tyrosine phosphatase family